MFVYVYYVCMMYVYMHVCMLVYMLPKDTKQDVNLPFRGSIGL